MHEAVYDEFIEKAAARAKARKVRLRAPGDLRESGGIRGNLGRARGESECERVPLRRLRRPAPVPVCCPALCLPVPSRVSCSPHRLL